MSAGSVFTRPRAVFLLASLCCLLWGSAYPAIKTGYALLDIAQDDVAAQLVFAGYRFMGAGALLLVFAGVVVVNLGGSVALEFQFLGEGFIILAALVLSSASIYGKRVSQGMDSVVMTGYQLTIGGAVLWLLGWSQGGHLAGFDSTTGLLLVYLAGLSAVAFSLWGALLKFNKVSRVTVFNFLIPIFGAGLSALFLGESLWAWKNLVALALVSLGIWWVTQEPAAPEPR